MISLARRLALVTFAAALGLSLSSCAPRVKAVPTVTTSTAFNSVSFYPSQTGLMWNYMEEGDTANLMPYSLRVLGPNLFLGQNVTAMQMVGRGSDQTWYRTFDSNGVKLFGISKPGATISLSPAWQEAPAPETWRVGLHWEGSSQIKIADDTGKIQSQGTLKYSYDVLDQRQVKTPGGTYLVWVVSRQINDDLGGIFPAAQQYWFAPFVGDIRTAEGLLMTGRNFTAGTGKGAGK